MGLINIDIGATKDRAGQIEELSVTVRNIANHTIDDMRDNIPGSWTGDGATRYIKSLNKINNRIKKRATNLKNISVGLWASADRLEQIEGYAVSLFKR